MHMHRSGLFWIKTASLAFVFALISILFTSPVLAQSLQDDSCSLEVGTPYRTQSISTVFVVTEDCQKRPIFNPDVYFSHFTSWDEVTFVASSELDLVPDHPLNFLPWGPLRTFGNGSLIKIVSDPRVYLIQNGRAYPIESEEAFLSIGYAFNQIEDVTEDVLSSFLTATTIIRGPEDVPAGLIFKYPDDPSVYILVEEDGELTKRHIETMEELESLYRGDRLAILPTTSVFANSAGSSVSSVPTTVIKNFYPSIPATPTTEDSTPASDTTAPVISSVASSTGETTATITWTTDESSTSTVEYGETDDYGSTTSSVALTTDHSIVIESLTADTTYHFRVSSQDASGNVGTSGDYTFLTTADTTAPVISSVASSTGETTATITWTTNESSTSTVEYGTTDSYGSTSSSVAFTTSHSIAIESLTADTVYHFRVSSSDDDGNRATSTDYTFLTTADVTAPVISSVASSTGETTATITWTTNESSTSTVEYGTTDSYGSTTSSVALTTDHSIVIESLTAATTYHFRVSSSDDDGNRATSTDYTFATLDLDAPIISSVATSTDGGTGATITWTTDESSTSTVEYGLTTDYGSTSSSVAFTTSHSITLADLTPNVTYHFRVSSKDASGNTATSTDYTFIVDEIIFEATNSTFTAYINVNAGATVLWTYADGTTSNSATTTKDYGTEATRLTRLKVTPWEALRVIDVGYDAGDGGPSSIALLAEQGVTSISGLENVAPYLEKIAASNNPITSLDLSDFVQLTHIECYHCTAMTSVDLSNTPSLIRANFYDNDLASLDLSESPALEDLRGALNAYTSITWGATGDYVWHIDVRENPQMTSNLPDFSQFPLLRDLYTGSANQSGALDTTSNTELVSLLAYGNSYTSADVSNSFSTGSYKTVNLNSNDLTSFTFNNDSGLRTIFLNDNEFSQVAIDGILTTLNAYATENGGIYLNNNSAPSSIGVAAAAALTDRGWTVEVESGPDVTDPVISSVASSTGETTATITWTTDENATSTVEYGETDSYGSTSSSVALTTSHSIVIDSLTAATTYHFRVSSQDEGGNVATSTDYTFETTGTPDTTAPVISSVASSTGETTATITWTTDESATSTVEYGETDSYGSTSSSVAFTTDHSIVIESLTPETVYHFRVSSQDESGNVATSTDYTFETDPNSDFTAPVISSVASSTTDITATITWTTDESATSTVEYGETDSYGSSSSSVAFTTDHSILIESLTVDTVYHFRVSSQDESGNVATSTDYTFATTADSAAPVISSVASSTSDGWALITWTTDENATSTVEYGTTDSYGSTTSTVALTTSHSIVITGLSSNTTYHYRVSSQDTFGNTATSSDSTFNTAGHVYWADYFNRADGATGNGWDTPGSATAEIVSNALRRTDSAGYQVYYNNTDITLPPDYVLTATVPHSTLSTSYWGIASRWSGGTGVRLLFSNPSTVTVGLASGWNSGNVTVTETGGFPDSWSVNQNHTISIKMVGTSGTVYLDGSEYGTFTLATNATLDGTGVAIVGEGNNRDWLDIRVTDYVPRLDETEPVISSVASSTTEATATITWQTDDVSDATVEYGTTDSYGSTSSTSVYGTTHSINLTGLAAETEYYFRVISQDAAGSSTSPGYTFQTLADTESPIIYSVASSTASSTTVIITWDTNENATSTVEYGLTDSYGSTSSTLALTTSHSIVIDDLTPDTLYHFRIVTQDATGKTTTSGDYTFHTVLWADLFERADGALGCGWAAYADGAAEIVSNALRMTHGTSYGVMYNMTNTTLPADYTVRATVPHNTLATPYWGITNRWYDGNGVRLIFGSPSTNVYAGQASAWDAGNVTITVTGGFPASWSSEYHPTHTIAIKMVGTSGSIILDDSEYGTFTLVTNNQTGTGVGIVGEGRDRDWYDIVVTSD